MAGDAELTADGWTLANFTGAIHRGGVGLWAWSPTRRVAQLDELCREFWGVPEAEVGIDALFTRVHAEDRPGMMEAWWASERDPQAYSFDFRIGQGPDALRPGQRAITSFNRNWQNRMGYGGEGYLASPAVVAASALVGYMAPPTELGLEWNAEEYGV